MNVEYNLVYMPLLLIHSIQKLWAMCNLAIATFVIRKISFQLKSWKTLYCNDIADNEWENKPKTTNVFIKIQTTQFIYNNIGLLPVRCTEMNRGYCVIYIILRFISNTSDEIANVTTQFIRQQGVCGGMNSICNSQKYTVKWSRPVRLMFSSLISGKWSGASTWMNGDNLPHTWIYLNIEASNFYMRYFSVIQRWLLSFSELESSHD